MWPTTFDQRLVAWYQLRSIVKFQNIELALDTINHWWSHSPWCPYYLHWDDQLTWPDPWQLLNNNVYCYLARGLGILYTISLLDRADMADAALILTESGHNLVSVAQRKYILNWTGNTVVNTNQEVNIIRKFEQHQTAQQYN
jgi:hypothetical protein